MPNTLVIAVMVVALVVMFGVVVWAARGGLDERPAPPAPAPPPRRKVPAANDALRDATTSGRRPPRARPLDEEELAMVVFADPSAAEAAFEAAFADAPPVAPPPRALSPFPSGFGEEPRTKPAAKGLFEDETSTVVITDPTAGGQPGRATAQGLFDTDQEELATVVFSSSMADDLLEEAFGTDESPRSRPPGR